VQLTANYLHNSIIRLRETLTDSTVTAADAAMMTDFTNLKRTIRPTS